MECQEQGQIDPVFDARLFFTGMGEGLQPLSEPGYQRINTQSGTRQLGEGQVYLTFFYGAVRSDAVPRHGPGLPRGLGQLLQHAERAGFSLLRPERYGGALYIYKVTRECRPLPRSGPVIGGTQVAARQRLTGIAERAWAAYRSWHSFRHYAGTRIVMERQNTGQRLGRLVKGPLAWSIRLPDRKSLDDPGI